ncbi:MAG: hypothetical protein ABSF73_04425 [Terriglobia bacterium]|jgi:hypothetical protein
MRPEGSKQKAGGNAGNSKQKAGGSKRTRTRGQGLGVALAAGLALMVGMATPSYGRSHRSAPTSLDPAITLRVFNYAGASTGVVAQAEEEVSYVFGQAGVKVIWRDCLATSAEPGCSEPIGPYNLTLRILPGKPKLQAGLHDGTLGFAVIPTVASVYSSQVEMLATSLGAHQDYGTLLGDAMAHELGHLLLGPGSHSHTGIMQPLWQSQILRQGTKRSLHFTPEQARRIRAEVSSRVKFLE